MRVLGLLFHRTEAMYNADKKMGGLTDLQEKWVIGIPANQAKYQMTPGFNRKFADPVNLQLSDFSKSCFAVFNFVDTPQERLYMWLNTRTLLFGNTKENVDLDQHPFDQDLDQLHEQMVQEATDEAMRRTLSCVQTLLDGGEVTQAKAYIDEKLKELMKRKMQQSIKKK